MAPGKYKNNEWQVLENFYHSSACQPLKKCFFFVDVVSHILLITAGMLILSNDYKQCYIYYRKLLH